jgi:hypothetical protein
MFTPPSGITRCSKPARAAAYSNSSGRSIRYLIIPRARAGAASVRDTSDQQKTHRRVAPKVG